MRIHQVSSNFFFEQIAIECKVFWGIFGDFWGREPNLCNKIRDFYFLSVSLDFLHEITLWAIDIDNNGCLEPFLPIWEHFWNRGSVQLNCIPDLTPRLKRNLCYLFCWDAPGLSDMQNKIEQQKKQEKNERKQIQNAKKSLFSESARFRSAFPLRGSIRWRSRPKTPTGPIWR